MSEREAVALTHLIVQRRLDEVRAGSPSALENSDGKGREGRGRGRRERRASLSLCRLFCAFALSLLPVRRYGLLNVNREECAIECEEKRESERERGEEKEKERQCALSC